MEGAELRVLLSRKQQIWGFGGSVLEFAVLRSHSQQHQSWWSCKAFVKVPEIVLILTVGVIYVKKFKMLKFVPEAGSSPSPRDAVEGLDAG